MVKVEIIDSLEKKINKIFKRESIKIFKLLKNLEDHPTKGKIVGNVGGLVVKELKYETYRFYFYVDGHKLKVLGKKDLEELLIRFVRMSDKKKQQKTINEIKKILKKIGEEGF